MKSGFNAIERPSNAKDFSDEELRIMLRMCGKYPIEEILIEVNKVSKHKRKLQALKNKAVKQGLSFALKSPSPA